MKKEALGQFADVNGLVCRNIRCGQPFFFSSLVNPSTRFVNSSVHGLWKLREHLPLF